MQIQCDFCKKNFTIKLDQWLIDYIERYKNGDCDEHEMLVFYPTLERELHSKNDFELITRNLCFDCWEDYWVKNYGWCQTHKFPKNK